MEKQKYKRILLKLSGEALMGEGQFGHDIPTINRICEEIADAHKQGLQICMVTGGGNIFRGMNVAETGMERASADYMGMLATVMNALALQNALENHGIDTRVLSAITMASVCEPFVRRRAVRHMERGRIVICAAGTGNPFFTTDTAASLRAVELGCDALLKATQVDGVYDADPKTNPNAKRYDTLTYRDVLTKDLRVMDTSAIALARENNLPIVVFSIHNKGALADVTNGRGIFTTIEGEG